MICMYYPSCSTCEWHFSLSGGKQANFSPRSRTGAGKQAKLSPSSQTSRRPGKFLGVISAWRRPVEKFSAKLSRLVNHPLYRLRDHNLIYVKNDVPPCISVV